MLPRATFQTFSAAAKPKGPIIKHSFKPIEIFLSSPSSPISSTTHTPSKSNHPRQQEEDQNPKRPYQSSSSSSLAAFVIAHNEHLATHILLRLPPKSLLRFQSVSKQWQSIISNPTFRRLHSRRRPTTTASCSPPGMLLFPFRFPRVLDFIAFRQEEVNSMANIVSHLNTFLYGPRNILALHSCNGLLAIVFDVDNREEFVVYNPTTRESKLVPIIETERSYRALNIVFDPEKSDHYKLVYTWLDTSGIYVHRISVYSSENGVWRNTEETATDDLCYDRGVSWNGDLHWIGPWNYSACFDVSNERLRPLRYTIRTPEFEEHGDDWYFGESGGHLFYIHPNEPYGTLLDFFELESERDCLRWNVKYHVDLTPLTTLYPQMIKEEYDPTFDEPCAFYIIGFLVDDKEKKATLVISLADKIISCDFNNLTLMELADVEVDTNYGFPDNDVYRWDFAFQHVETLACL
nr:F-box protein At5g07610-like isoform X1 [Coffea arabica]